MKGPFNLPNIRKILFVSLSNLGDIVLTTPVFRELEKKFPDAVFDVITGPAGEPIFTSRASVRKVIVRKRRQTSRERITETAKLRKEKYDLVVDLKNSFLPLFVGARHAFPAFPVLFRHGHMKDVHLNVIKKIVSTSGDPSGFIVPVSEEDKKFVSGIMGDEGENRNNKPRIVTVNPGAKSHLKRWGISRYAEFISGLEKKLGCRVLIVGGEEDRETAKDILRLSGSSAENLSGKTSLGGLYEIIRRSDLFVTNDSGPLHIASAALTPTVAIFGPSDEKKYGPLSPGSVVFVPDMNCRPCGKAQCRKGFKDGCISAVTSGQVLEAAEKILLSGPSLMRESRKIGGCSTGEAMRILVTRTDRMGDVILSIPAVRHLRKVSPESYIAFMVALENKELVENEKDIDEVIVYDKKSKHRGFWSNLAFAAQLRKKKFDIAIALHPANRTHLTLFAAGIPRRVGYNKKWPGLLTEKLPHEKQLGEKHESDYNFEVISASGFDITEADRKPRVVVSQKAVGDIEKRLREAGVSGKIAVLHAGASCKSKMWPLERFAEAADILFGKYSINTVIVGDPSCSEGARVISGMMKKKPLDLTGSLGLSQLAALFSLASVTISNDSGPAHLAAAVGSPVVVIFGRNDPGLSPKRWAPITDKKRVLHHPPACSPCLAHNCKIGFLCLKNITVSDVVSGASELIK